jgi:hypothetical protein
MTDPKIEAAATEAVAKAEAAATRRRWINLGEFVAVAGLIIAAISLYLNYADRKADLADKQAEKTSEAHEKARYSVKSDVRGRDLVIIGDDRHTIGDISVSFPSDLGIGQQTSATQTIAGDWYERALLKATDGGPDSRTGKLPVLLTVNYMDDDTQRSTTGIFDIVWRTEKGFPPFGRKLKVVSMRLHQVGGSQAQIDKLWAADKPAS